MRDALIMGPHRGQDTITPHTRPPADDDAEQVLVPSVECIDGTVEVELVCEPAYRTSRNSLAASETDAPASQVLAPVGDWINTRWPPVVAPLAAAVGVALMTYGIVKLA